MTGVRRDSGMIVVGWLTRVAVALAIVGVALFDGIAVGAGHLNAADDASQAASAAGFEWRQSHDVQLAYQAALGSLSHSDETIPPRSFVIEPDGSVRLEVHRTVSTLLLSHLGPLARYDQFTVTGDAPPATA